MVKNQAYPINTLVLTFTALIITYISFGQTYIQQEVNYQIEVELNDAKHQLSGFERITYINNSPEKLEYIYFHLWPNAYSSEKTALAKQVRRFNYDDRGYIDSLDFKVNGQPIKWEYDSIHQDICKLFLKKPILSGDSIIISTPFKVKIPSGDISRLGHIDQSYQITQWYPKPAVYDQHGWHPMPYLNMGEFYSEFGSFEVSITLPQNYIIGATGNLQNKNEQLFLDSIAKETLLIETFSKELEFPTSSKELKTLTYKEDNIHDFAWFADKRFHILKGEVVLPNSNNKVTTFVMFTNKTAHLWKEALEYVNDAIHYYSLWYGDYPYKQCTAIQAPLAAGGGMEYPTITVIGDMYTPLSLEAVIAHEVGHNWFYGILASNERDHPWMDEGINSFSEDRYIQTKYPTIELYKMMFEFDKLARTLNIDHLEYIDFHSLLYLFSARTNSDQPSNLHSEDYTEINYGTIVYGKAARIIHTLHDYLGEKSFNNMMQEYFNTWKFKHPYPEDFQKIASKYFQGESSWFFEDLLKTTRKLDYGISRVKKNKVLIKNHGQISSPLSVGVLKDDSLRNIYHFDGFDKKKWIEIPNITDSDQLIIDPLAKTPDINRKNNQYKTSGIFKKQEPLHISLIGILENPKQTNIHILPSIGINNNNKEMLGLVLYSPLLPQQKFEYELIPMYGFGNKNLAGVGRIQYNILPFSNIFSKISVSLSAKQFAFNTYKNNNFRRIKGEIAFSFKKNAETSSQEQSVTLSMTHASDMEQILISQKILNGPLNPIIGFKQFYQIKYNLNNAFLGHPFGFNIGFLGSDNFINTSSEAYFQYNYNASKNIILKLFGGAFLYKENNLSYLYDFTLNGSHGFNDYMYDGTFFNRFNDDPFNDFFAKQMVMDQGLFTVGSNFSSTNKWIFSGNLTSSLPLPNFIPIKAYSNFSFLGNKYKYGTTNPHNQIYYELGLKAFLLNNFIEVYFPLLQSKEITDYLNNNTDSYGQRIRFTLNLNLLNPRGYFKEILE